MMKGLVLISRQNLLCFLIVTFQMKDICLKKLILRIFQPVLTKLVKTLMGIRCPGIKIHSATDISQIFPDHLSPVLFLQKIDIYSTLCSAGCQHPKDQLLIWKSVQ